MDVDGNDLPDDLEEDFFYSVEASGLDDPAFQPPSALRHAPCALACLSGPNGVAFDPSGNLYIADDNNHSIRKYVLGIRRNLTLSLD